MRKLFCLLLCFGLLAGCQTAEPEGVGEMKTPGFVYEWEEVGATILLPEGTLGYCDAEVAEDGSVWFCFKEGGDTAFWMVAYKKGVEVPMEEQLGVFTLGETDSHIIQVMTSTCGTLNNEKIRPLWEEMREKAAEMTEENIILAEQ